MRALLLLHLASLTACGLELPGEVRDWTGRWSGQLSVAYPGSPEGDHFAGRSYEVRLLSRSAPDQSFVEVGYLCPNGIDGVLATIDHDEDVATWSGTLRCPRASTSCEGAVLALSQVSMRVRGHEIAIDAAGQGVGCDESQGATLHFTGQREP